VHYEAVVSERAGVFLHDGYSAGDGADEVAVRVEKDLGESISMQTHKGTGRNTMASTSRAPAPPLQFALQ
jgi:hypothetical protein